MNENSELNVAWTWVEGLSYMNEETKKVSGAWMDVYAELFSKLNLK